MIGIAAEDVAKKTGRVGLPAQTEESLGLQEPGRDGLAGLQIVLKQQQGRQ